MTEHLLTALRDTLEEAATQGVAEVERSRAPQWHKSAEKGRIRRALEPHRPLRKRIVLEAEVHEGSVPIDPMDIGLAIKGGRGTVWRGADGRLRAVRHGVGGRGELALGSGQLRSLAERLPKLAPCPDGLPYAFSAAAPPECDRGVRRGRGCDGARGSGPAASLALSHSGSCRSVSSGGSRGGPRRWAV